MNDNGGVLKEQLDDFDKFAHDYKAILDKSLELGGEKGEYFSKYKADFVSRRVGKDFSGKILDYGCGIGLLSEDLLQHMPHATVDGMDVSTASIEHVPSHLKKQGLFTCDINSLRQDYDVIVIANVLHHVEMLQRRSVIAKLKGLIKKKGKIIIFEHNPINPLTCKIVRESPLDRGVVLLLFFRNTFIFKKCRI